MCGRLAPWWVVVPAGRAFSKEAIAWSRARARRMAKTVCAAPRAGLWVVLALAHGCATSTPYPLALSSPSADSWPDGWGRCSAEQSQRSIELSRAGVEQCDLGRTACTALRQNLQQCGLGPRFDLVALVNTDESGRVTQRCLAASRDSVAAETMACVGRALDGIGATATPALKALPVRVSTVGASHVRLFDGGLNANQVMGVIWANKSGVEGCVDRQRKANPRLTGKIIYSWLISSAGTTSEVSLVTKEHEGTVIAECLKEFYGGLQFAPHQPASEEPVYFPVVF